MKVKARALVAASILLSFLSLGGCAKSPDDSHQMAGRVKTEFLHAWNNYERYAWGRDALKPLSKTSHDGMGSRSS
jgi:hypothetical protein